MRQIESSFSEKYKQHDRRIKIYKIRRLDQVKMLDWQFM